MKRPFFLGLGTILVLIIALVVYGTYLNQRGESQIAERMSDQTIPLRGAKVQMRQLKPRLALDTLNLYSDKMADAVALLDGRITSIDVEKNDRVVQGQPLFTVTNDTQSIKIRQADIDILKVDNEIIQSDNEILKAETNLARSKSDFERYNRLIIQEAVTAEKFEEIEASYKEAQVNLKNAHVHKESLLAQKEYLTAQKEQLLIENSYSEVIAPIDGEVLILYKTQGSYVTAGTAMALVGDFRTLNFSVDIEDKFTKRFKPGDMATLNFNRADFSKIYDTEYEAGNSGREQKFTAQIVEITPSPSVPASIRKILWAVDNRAGLLEPQNYNATALQMNMPRSCLTIPLTAMTSPARNEVFVVVDGKIYRREIETGSDDGIFIEVVKGLKENELVVTSGTDG
ncbi:MAG: efflux RND transporter periplasmic adaptor subunit, partial [Selenomonadaceae bacterium]|nr:efflux RND transporter periplasmic adaptor subunit [Selenomonadaceae bacterium]